jgi:AhpD family alkylhydroperoxidase
VTGGQAMMAAAEHPRRRSAASAPRRRRTRAAKRDVLSAFLESWREPFPRRHFAGPGHFLSSSMDIFARVAARSGPVRGPVEETLRQRLWLAVTHVNDCRYCFWVHTRLALRSGVPADEVDALCSGRITKSPPDERPALRYARKWAEREGRPDPKSRARLAGTYGEEKASGIESVLQLIRWANLTGNTWDLVLHRVSGGRLDVHRHFPFPVKGWRPWLAI